MEADGFNDSNILVDKEDRLAARSDRFPSDSYFPQVQGKSELTKALLKFNVREERKLQQKTADIEADYVRARRNCEINMRTFQSTQRRKEFQWMKEDQDMISYLNLPVINMRNPSSATQGTNSTKSSQVYRPIDAKGFNRERTAVLYEGASTGILESTLSVRTVLPAVKYERPRFQVVSKRGKMQIRKLPGTLVLREGDMAKHMQYTGQGYLHHDTVFDSRFVTLEQTLRMKPVR